MDESLLQAVPPRGTTSAGTGRTIGEPAFPDRSMDATTVDANLPQGEGPISESVMPIGLTEWFIARQNLLRGRESRESDMTQGLSPEERTAQAREEGRLAALYRYALLDSPREGAFDALVEMGARYFDVPYAVISLIDRDRIWFKSRYGIDDPEVVRTPGLCATAIQQDEIYHLLDASQDEVARHHPLVEPADGIRFYAGAPLRSEDGFNIGSICVMGHEPRDLSDNDRRFLESLGRLTINEVERRYATEQLEMLNRDLDARVQLRTRELDGLIADLKREAFEKSEINEALIASEQQQRRIAEVASDFCFEVELDPDAGSRLLWVTGDLEGIMGWTLAEIDLTDWTRYVHPEDRMRLPGMFESATTSGRAEFEYRFRCKSGAYRWVRLSLSATSRKTNLRSMRFLAAVKDLQSLRSAEEVAEARSRDLEQSRVQLHEARRLAWLGTVAAGMAHQINNPVGSMLAAAEFALSDRATESGTVAHDALEDIRSEALRCGKIVRSILQFARQESTPKTRMDLCEIVDSAVQLAETYAHDHHVKIETLIHAKGAVPVHLSSVEIEEVLVNLLRNAVESKPATAIRISLDVAHGEAVVRVVDDGVGIPVELTRRIFDPFFTTRLAQGGTGLGLSLSDGIIADHSGKLELTSRPDEGTTVTVRLPMAGD